MTISYLDCNATTPIEPSVAEIIQKYMLEEFGNAGSRTHSYGSRAKKAVIHAREQVAALAGVSSNEVIFTSGATEANNLAILGLFEEGERLNKRHVVSTKIEHKAVLEPLEELSRRGWEVTLLPPSQDGIVTPEEVHDAMRDDTILVSIMHGNNETGTLQPIEEISKILMKHDAYLHIDAAQTFGKLPLHELKRCDLISVSSHKCYGPKGVGALIAKRREYRLPPLKPLMFGGGQERGLRPGTLPVPLIVGFGLACELSAKKFKDREAKNLEFRGKVVSAIDKLGGVQNGSKENCLAHVINVSIPGLDSEAAIVALKDIAAISNGSACTSSSYTPSHVLQAMGFNQDRIDQAIRLSWSHLTEEPNWNGMISSLNAAKMT
jgi:cysteine desulfurase